MDEEVGLFSGDADNVISWVGTGGFLLTAAAIGLLVWILTRSTAWRLAPTGKWGLLVALLLLPSVSMLLGNVVGFHNVRQSCADCHTMDPWVKDMKDPKSETLAALHYQNRLINEDQCYTCHTGYGLGGNIQAKLSGMKHVWHYYFAGVPEEIKISKPFPVKTCNHCHAGQRSYNKVEEHVFPEFKDKILSGEMSCFECHAAPHPREEAP